MTIPCPHWTRKSDRGAGNCSLGWYGGKPFVGNCLDCIAAGENAPEAKAALDARAETSHPTTRPRLSGCCDRADQA
jgi:hypothetical protein